MVLLVDGHGHRDAHPEVLRGLKRLHVRILYEIAVEHCRSTRVFVELVALDLEVAAQLVEVELAEILVQEAELDAETDIVLEVRLVDSRELFLGLIAAQHLLIDGLEEETGCDLVIVEVILRILESRIDSSLVHFLGRDAVIDRELGLGRDLHDLFERILETIGRTLDGTVDAVRIERKSRSVALHHLLADERRSRLHGLGSLWGLAAHLFCLCLGHDSLFYLRLAGRCDFFEVMETHCLLLW